MRLKTKEEVSRDAKKEKLLRRIVAFCSILTLAINLLALILTILKLD